MLIFISVNIEDTGFGGELIDNRREGKWILRYQPDAEESPLKKEAHYVEGVLHGLYAEYWETGFRMYCVFENGLPHGPCKHYFSNGQLRYEGHFREGNKDGTWISYTQNGQLMAEVDFEKGFEIGHRISYYDQDWKEPIFDFRLREFKC